MNLTELLPALSSSLDPVFVVNEKNQIIYATKAAKTLLQLKPRDIGVAVLCDRLKMDICASGCKVLEAIQKKKELRFDEVPSVLGSSKVRVAVKTVPISGGAIVTVRDTSAELLVQAKYHKLSEILKEKDAEIQDLREELREVKRRR